jgi:thiol-disulfide isomerase/thioredoxin
MLRRASITRPASAEARRDLAAVYAKLGRREDAEREQAILAKLGPIREAPRELAGPKVGQAAPEFTLPQLGSRALVQLKTLRRKTPVLVVFGSYSCPKLRSAAPAIAKLHDKHGKNVAFLLVYIREAHASNNWQSTINEREDVKLTEPKTLAEREQHADLCRRKLSLHFPTAVDDLHNTVEKLYHAWPSRAFLVGRDGVILWSSLLDELSFRPAELESAILAAPGAR